MAVNVLMPLLIPLGEQITNVTQLAGVGNLAFAPPRVEVFVKENAAPVFLLTLHAASNTTESEVTYSVVAGGVGGVFVVDARAGGLTLRTPLDFEARQSYEVVVEGQAGAERAYAHVMVLVTDVNDEPPTFSRPLYETQITEEDDRHLPKPILQVAAVDRDASDEGRLRYMLRGDGGGGGGGGGDRFSINETSGHIQLLRPLDRDAPSGRARWDLRVQVTDGVHTASARVHVNVKDINDNAPFFPSQLINASVPENARAGADVTQVTATDYDDAAEGSNAVVSYSVEKNVIDDQSGQPIFAIDASSGRITTALCCLDRERTSSYTIHVVASDGGGLKGTGTVLVRVGDENDVSPRFSRREWQVTVHESVTANTSLATLTVLDPDASNDFAFRVVEGSGHGWDKFRVTAAGNRSGSLQAVEALDYEDPRQRQGFRFKVQVSDKGADGWREPAQLDWAWVVVNLLDDNDNAPDLSKRQVNLTLPEDTPIGHLLASFTAHDRDQGGRGEVHYSIAPGSDPGRRFVVDSVGRVRLQRLLDREAAARHEVRVLAVDEGAPPRTATATLSLSLTDVNDNAPHVAHQDPILVPENTRPGHVATLALDDPDDWSLGHGPPFAARLDDNAAPDIKNTFAVEFDQSGDSGRGVALVSTLTPLDREVAATRLLPLVVADARGLTATATVTLTVGDANDNPMAAAAKTISVVRLTGESGDVPVGRVYVDDPDDWDAADKTWAWRARERHPLFTLDAYTGSLSMSGHAHDSTYFLQFWVSDVTHAQVNEPANVTITVSSLNRDVITCAVPVTITTHSPQSLVTAPAEGAGSPLDTLIASVEAVAGVGVQVVSLEARIPSTQAAKAGAGAKVWLSGRPRHPLDQLLLLHRMDIFQMMTMS